MKAEALSQSIQNETLVCTELYYPEETSTGYFMTGIAEGLVERGKPVRVLSAQPTYSRRGETALKNEIRNGVIIRRVHAPSGDKNHLAGRIWNVTNLSLSFGIRLLKEVRNGSTILVVTNPPTLPFLARIVALLRGARCILVVHDMYPDVLTAVGLLRKDSILYRLINSVQNFVLCGMSRIVVLGRDMEKRIHQKDNRLVERTVIIPNWGDIHGIRPLSNHALELRQKFGLEKHFIVQFSGNLGRTHGIDDLLALVENNRNDSSIHFVVFGWGAAYDYVAKEIETRELGNITLHSPCARKDLEAYLNLCDLFFLPFREGMEGISVPSRLYNVMAAGRPVLAVTSPCSELAQVVIEENMGWVVQPGDLDGMQTAIDEARSDINSLSLKGKNARSAATTKYTREKVVDAFAALIGELAVGGRA